MNNYGHHSQAQGAKYGHQPCPSCPSHDAYFVYKDGHGHCYSCGYHDHGTKTIASMKLKLNPNELAPEMYTTISTANYTYDLPEIARKWLKKYDISDKEIHANGIMWNEKGESLVFPLRNRQREIFATNERYFGSKPNHPKYITKGNKTKEPVFVGYDLLRTHGNYRNVVAVEDYISAIKVGRQSCCVPLLGTTIPSNWIVPYAAPGVPAVWTKSSVIIWLDPDKHQEALFQKARVSQYMPFSKVIFSDKDPKDYNDEEIKKYIESAV